MTAGLDGNALGGMLADVFVGDVTAAVATCAGCGAAGPIAATLVSTMQPGAIARCPSCENIVLRLVCADGRAWLDLRGVSVLELSLSDLE
jgi:hypothetical protein